MRVLLVDDSYSKVEDIAAALANAGVSKPDIEHASTAHAARIFLRNSSFEMLLIDLHLPSVVGASPSAKGGLELFDTLCLDENVNLPPDVLFITGKEDLLVDANEDVIRRGAQLAHYSKSSDTWKRILQGRAKYLQHRLDSRNTRPKHDPVDIAIVTALQTPELQQVLRLPYGWRAVRTPDDPTTYHFGSFQKDGGAVKIVAACAQRKGMPSSAALASKLAHYFKPKYLVMLGICAGIRKHSNVGDVVVADPTWDWGAGKRGESTSGSPVFLAAPYQVNLSSNVRELARDLALDPKVLGSIRAGWDAAVPGGTLAIHVGPMASGASVIADRDTAHEIVAQHKELLAVEMEGYAVMAAAEYAPNPKPVAVVIKSVCDFADPSKNDDWQSYAAYTSAAFADQLFRNVSFSTAKSSG